MIRKLFPGHLDSERFEATRYTLREGASFSGWVVRSKHDMHWCTDPLPNERAAREAMVEMIVADAVTLWGRAIQRRSITP